MPRGTTGGQPIIEDWTRAIGFLRPQRGAQLASPSRSYRCAGSMEASGFDWKPDVAELRPETHDVGDVLERAHSGHGCPFPASIPPNRDQVAARRLPASPGVAEHRSGAELHETRSPRRVVRRCRLA